MCKRLARLRLAAAIHLPGLSTTAEACCCSRHLSTHCHACMAAERRTLTVLRPGMIRLCTHAIRPVGRFWLDARTNRCQACPALFSMPHAVAGSVVFTFAATHQYRLRLQAWYIPYSKFAQVVVHPATAVRHPAPSVSHRRSALQHLQQVHCAAACKLHSWNGRHAQNWVVAPPSWQQILKWMCTCACSPFPLLT